MDDVDEHELKEAGNNGDQQRTLNTQRFAQMRGFMGRGEHVTAEMQ